MARYRLTRYTRRDMIAAVGNTRDFKAFFEAFMRDCRDDFPDYDTATFVSGDPMSIVFEVPDEHQPAFTEMIADLNPSILERI